MPELDAGMEVECDVLVTDFANHLGEPIQRVTPLWWHHPSGERISGGFVVHYLTAGVSVVDIGDELLVDSWQSRGLLDRGLLDDNPDVHR